MRLSRRSTFHEVARLARVSAATVSRVVNRSARVDPSIERRVRAAAEKLGVSLERRHANRLIAFLLCNRSLMHPFHSQVLVASEAYCGEHDYSLLFFPLHYPNDAGWEKLHVPRILRRRDSVDGFIVSGVSSENLLELLSHIGLPFAVFGDTVQGPWKPDLYDTVWIDDITGGYETTRYLHSLGHTHIWYVANRKLAWFARRYEGYCRAVKELGLKELASSLDLDNEQEVGFLATKYILQGGEPLQAIFCGSDATAHGVYTALRDSGLRVPEDVSVAGFNDTPEATVLHPPMTSVRVFPELVGRSLSELVLNRVSSGGLPRQERMIPTRLVKRESCQSVLGAAEKYSLSLAETAGL